MWKISHVAKLVPEALLVSASIVWAAPSGDTWAIDPRESSLTVHVFKSGLLSAFGDNHDVRAVVASGSVVGGEKPSVELAIDARQMQVLDPDLAPAKRAEVQKRMMGPEVLDVARFPEIRFESTAVRPLSEGRWQVEGLLALHGRRVPLSFDVTNVNQRLRGSATLSQRAFGIEPIKAGGGTINVKDEVKIDFDIVTASP
ncbi:MAG: YceI family protein [Thermoanaerobaculia bacterium]